MSFVVERATGKILDLECNTILSVTRNFCCVDAAWKEFENRFGRDAAEYPGKVFALTQKPLIACLKDAHNRYMMVTGQK